MNRLIRFLIRRKLGLKIYERFRFANQRSENDFYYFGKYALLKVDGIKGYTRPANVSLNHLLSRECEIVKVVGI